ncbi:MAG: hypothetical protein CSA65_04105 [Proteobacteria bacterium]|nr:MAG: hypothetical protein CSB49_08725 [Pseudomonadota bacterium]PIE18752.1 MAG: hypothetical protein CSA65_04105 [Pseudomonadota bacterium]
MTAHAETIAFRPRQRRTQARVKRRRRQLAELRPARVARRLALAHRIAADIEAGRYKDYADVARRHVLTRARLTQLMNLLLLAPDIQEEVLALEFPVGREPVTERTLRRVLASLCWEDQRAAWAELRPEADLAG